MQQPKTKTCARVRKTSLLFLAVIQLRRQREKARLASLAKRSGTQSPWKTVLLTKRGCGSELEVSTSDDKAREVSAAGSAGEEGAERTMSRPMEPSRGKGC